MMATSLRKYFKGLTITNFFDFLGFTIYISHKVPRKEAARKYKDAIRRATRRNLPINLGMVIQRRNPVVIGWGNYYKIANVNGLYKNLDSWTRMRPRAFKEKKKSYLCNYRIRNKFSGKSGFEVFIYALKS